MGSSVLGVDRVEIRVRAAAAQVVVNGVTSPPIAADSVTTIDTPRDRCTLVRITTRGGFSGVVYANCPFAG